MNPYKVGDRVGCFSPDSAEGKREWDPTKDWTGIIKEVGPGKRISVDWTHPTKPASTSSLEYDYYWIIDCRIRKKKTILIA